MLQNKSNVKNVEVKLNKNIKLQNPTNIIILCAKKKEKKEIKKMKRINVIQQPAIKPKKKKVNLKCNRYVFI